MVGWLRSRRKFKTKAYSLELQQSFRELRRAVYQEGGETLVFEGELIGKKWQQINLRAPSELLEANRARVLKNVGEALERLGYEFLIFRTGTPVPIPKEEQQAAIAGLREMGIEPQICPDGSRVELKKLPKWQGSSPSGAQAQAFKMMGLVRIARGVRSPIEILAKSKSAVVDFI